MEQTSNDIALSIVTPYGSIYNGEIKHIVMPGNEGEFGVFPGHCDLLSELKAGVIEFEGIEGNKELVAISSGYASISQHSVRILAEGAKAIGGSSESEIAQAIDEAKILLSEASDTNVVSSVVARIENVVKNRI